MNLSSEILSDITIFSKYAKFLPSLNRRETWEEIIMRNCDMHIAKFPFLKDEIYKNYSFVLNKQTLPSMRSLQFAGPALDLNNVRMYNCSAMPISTVEAFSEMMFLLLSGSGVGYSVQKHHVAQLPPLIGPSNKHHKYLIGDSIIGWADAVKTLVKAYFFGKAMPIFDYRDIRSKGSLLVTSGGRAPGPEPLKDGLHNIQKILERALNDRGRGTQLKPIEAHDICCYIADCVLSGGIRRAACLALFSFDDIEMLECKFDNWWESNPQRARSNNSVALLRHKVKKKDYQFLWERIEASNSGEPGVYFTNDKEMLVNPCQPAFAKVMTMEGIRNFGDVNIGDRIWAGDRWTVIKNKWSTGIKPVYEYVFSAGTFIGTENHRVCNHGEKIEVDKTDCIDCWSGPNNWTPKEINPQDIMDGLVIGDGGIHKASNNLIGLYIGKKDQDYFDSEISKLIIKYRPGITPYFYEINTTISLDELPKTYDRFVPDRFIKGSLEKKCGFLRGLFTANGSTLQGGKRVSLKQTSFRLIKDVQLMLSSIGIRSYITINKPKTNKFINGMYEMKQSYDLNISSDCERFYEVVGFIQKYKSNTKKFRRSKSRYTNSTLLKKTYIGDFEVFDITVSDQEHVYWTGGCLVSNCNEAALEPYQFCNLTTVNVSDIKDQKDFNDRVMAAAFIGTIQAPYTDFHYLRPIWKETTEKDALLGVSLTGIASNRLGEMNIEEAANYAAEENKRVAKMIGINPARRVTLIKPEGTSSLVLGTSSGIHPWHSEYYIRRLRFNKNESIYKYLKSVIPDLIEDDFFKPNTDGVLSIPVKAPDGAITRSQITPISLLETMKTLHEQWIQPCHFGGDNSHNVSITVNIRSYEWKEVGEWLWKNRDCYNGVAVLPYDTGTYKQPPFEEITKDEYEKLYKYLKHIDLTNVKEEENLTDFKQIASCAGGACEVV